MRNVRRIVWLLALSLALSSCASIGRAAKPVACPILPPVPPSLQDKTNYVEKVCGEFLDGSESCKPSATASKG